MKERALLLAAAAVMVVACGGSDEAPAVCVTACDRIEDACQSTTPDCVDDCADDLVNCGDEMLAVLDCVLVSELQCDADQDQGLAEAPCQAEHDAAEVCGSDPF